MQIEILEKKKFYKGKQRLFWEILVDGKVAEVTLFDPTDSIKELCSQIEKEGGSYTEETQQL
jgi:hypothetical protein